LLCESGQVTASRVIDCWLQARQSHCTTSATDMKDCAGGAFGQGVGDTLGAKTGTGTPFHRTRWWLDGTAVLGPCHSNDVLNEPVPVFAALRTCHGSGSCPAAGLGPRRAASLCVQCSD